MIGAGDDDRLRRKRRADVAVFGVGREDLHARTVGYGVMCSFLERGAVEHRHVASATDGNLHFFAVRRGERFVW